jgi:hypothetical protein
MKSKCFDNDIHRAFTRPVVVVVIDNAVCQPGSDPGSPNSFVGQAHRLPIYRRQAERLPYNFSVKRHSLGVIRAIGEKNYFLAARFPRNLAISKSTKSA